MLDIELLIFAAVAIFVLTRLYAVLGRRTGDDVAPGVVSEKMTGGNVPVVSPDPATVAYTGPGAETIAEIARRDENFTIRDFIAGARVAYELIVKSFAKGDIDALEPLVTKDVHDAYADEVRRRDEKSTSPIHLVRLRSADIHDADLASDGVASISTLFEAELRSGDTQKRVREVWTFQRLIGHADPNWLLAEVNVAV